MWYNMFRGIENCHGIILYVFLIGDVMGNFKKTILTASFITALTGAAACAASYFTVKLMVDGALERTLPPVLKNAGNVISGKKADSGFMDFINQKSDALKNRDNEIIEITSKDGIKLVGHYIPAAKKANRLIIAVHGWRSIWHRDFGMVTDFWHNIGCDILYIEQRGQNNSEGDCMGFGLTERFDVLDWVNYSIDRFGNSLPIYLAGVSMGSATVLMASGLNLPENVHGIIADCGFTSPDDIWRHVAKNNLHIPYGIEQTFAYALFKKKTKYGLDEYSTVDALRENKTPILFIHGSNDHFVPVRMTYENFKACKAPKELLIVPGADHAMSYYSDTARYEEYTKRFFAKYDK